MSDAFKHAVGTATAGLGFFATISLAQINLLVGITCGIVGIIAGCCTINSWWRKRKKHTKKNHP